MSLPRVLKPQNPSLFDIPIGEAQDILSTDIVWLTHIFGKSQKLVKLRDKRKYTYPGTFVHGSQEKYIDLLPTKEYGNFCFFTVSDPQTLDFKKNRFSSLKAEMSIIFWFDLTTISLSTDRRIEAVKEEILQVLTRKLFLKTGRFTLGAISEEARSIYSEYSIDEIDTQFLMQPYCGLRFKGDILIREGVTC